MSEIKWVLYDWFGYNWLISQKIHLLIQSECGIFWLKKFSNAFGDRHMFLVHLSLLLGAMYVYLYRHQQDRAAEVVRYVKHIAVWFCSIVIGLAIIKALKCVLHYARPCCLHEFNLTEHAHRILRTDYCATADYSFPSGHTAYIALFVASFWSLMNKKLRVISVCLVGLMMFSRVALGRHFLADTVYALLIAIYVVQPLSTVLVGRYYPRYEATLRRYADYLFRARKKSSIGS